MNPLQKPTTPTKLQKQNCKFSDSSRLRFFSCFSIRIFPTLSLDIGQCRPIGAASADPFRFRVVQRVPNASHHPRRAAICEHYSSSAQPKSIQKDAQILPLFCFLKSKSLRYTNHLDRSLHIRENHIHPISSLFSLCPDFGLAFFVVAMLPPAMLNLIKHDEVIANSLEVWNDGSHDG